MNLLFSGALMIGEGGKLSLAERITAAVTAGGILFVMLLFMHRAVSATGAEEMPFLDVASVAGLGTIASLALLLAIVTTMAGCAYLLIDRLTALTRDAFFAASLTTLAGYVSSAVGFAPLVAYVYPVVSFLGLASTLAAVCLAIMGIVKIKRDGYRMGKS